MATGGVGAGGTLLPEPIAQSPEPIAQSPEPVAPLSGAELGFDFAAHHAHVRAALRLLLYEAHDLAHVLDGGGARLRDRIRDELVELRLGKLLGQVGLEQLDFLLLFRDEVLASARDRKSTR